ncbi:hypothetical protein F4054_06080 [Candidatus Poribacteria bacterium]|nr:hypothetical protein [Candidatus Poribacteria bacterium]MYK21812.1 hypothetical protein [Candidatus Poribacteria bacterium]
MLNRKQVLTVAGILILVSIAIFLMSHQTPPETVVIYKAVEFTPKTEKRAPSASHPNSNVEMGAIVSEDVDVSAPHTDDAVESTETALLLDELFFGEILDETESEDTEAEEEIVPVSPHGFGPYPEVPADFPIDVNWSTYETKQPVFELMTRVQIKLWEQGHNVTGISHENGVMHPIIRGTVYIEWSRDGKEFLGITGHPEDMSDAVVDQIESGNIPTWLTVQNFYTTGIDPYQFLDLQ